jgi:hypothetical protein
MLPRHPAGTLALDQRPCRPGGQAAPQPGRPALSYGQPWCQPATANAHHRFPSGPMQAGDHAARGPRGHINRWTQPRGGPPPRATPGPARRGQRGGSAADTAGLSVRTPGCSGRLDTGRVDAGRPLDRLDGRIPPRRDRGRGQGNDRLAGVRTPSRPATPAGRPTAPGSRRLGTLGHPGRLRGDGTCAAALTAAATGQLPSTARHEAAPRRTALLRRIGSRPVRNDDCHPVHIDE